jgi:hypothetical protein
MSRIKSETPMKAYDHVAKLLKDSAGQDGVISRKDAKAIVADLKANGRGTEALAAENIFKMIDARDQSDGNRVTGYDLTKDRTFVKNKMIENRDINRNGLSRAEVEKMSPTGRALVELGRSLALDRSKTLIEHTVPEMGLHHTAAMIREASKKDLITSKSDRDAYCNKLYKEGRGTEMLAVRTFFNFIDARDAGSGSRMTDKDIDRAVEYATTSMLRNKDTNGDGYSKDEVDNFSKSAKAFLLIGEMIGGKIIQSKASATGEGTQKLLRPLVKGLEFDQLGSEGGQPVKTVMRDGPYEKMDRAAVRDALKLPDNGNPVNKIETFRNATADDMKTFIENNTMTWKNNKLVEDPAKVAQAESAIAVLRGLKDLKIVVTGEDGTTNAAHPTYFVGLAQDGSMVGIQSKVIWT